MSNYPFRPTPWGVECAFHGWSGRRGDLDHVIPNGDIRVIPGPQTVDNIDRAELTPRLAMLNRKVFGFVADIQDAPKMLNTETCYRLQVVIQIVYYRDAEHGEDSWMWVKTNAFTSNALLVDAQSLMLGAIICGILTPTFGTHLATQLESWMISSCDEWSMGGLGGRAQADLFDIDPETVGHLPVLGGGAFDISRLRYSISGVRLRPPSLDPHLFHRNTSGAKDENEKKARSVSIDPRGVDDCGYRKTPKGLYAKVQTKEKRDESVLAHARRTHSRRQETEGRNREEKRGRPTEPRRSWVEYTDVGRRQIDPNAQSAPSGP